MKLTLYDIDQFIRKKTDNKQKAHYSIQEATIIEGNAGVLLIFFNCDYREFESLDDVVNIELMEIDNDDPVFSFESLEITLRELKEKAPSKEIDSDEYFHGKNYNFSAQKKFLELKKALSDIGFSLT